MHISYSLQTNATTLTDEFCAFSESIVFLIGVSLDGTRKIHGAHRSDNDQNGTYSLVMQGIELLKKHNAVVNTKKEKVNN